MYRWASRGRVVKAKDVRLWIEISTYRSRLLVSLNNYYDFQLTDQSAYTFTFFFSSSHMLCACEDGQSKLKEGLPTFFYITNIYKNQLLF